MGAVLLLGASAGLAAGQKVASTSVYTTLDEKVCKTLHRTAEDASSEQLCPGVGGFALRVLDGDARQSITVVSPDGRLHPLSYSEVVTQHFSTVGPRAEWRMQARAGGLVPVALTVRVNANEDDGQPAKITSYVVVARVDAGAICVVKVLRSSVSALEGARRIADQAGSLPCVKKTERPMM